MSDTSFTAWFEQVNAHVVSLVGLTCSDLPDKPYYDWFDAGMSPKSAAVELLIEEGFYNHADDVFDEQFELTDEMKTEICKMIMIASNKGWLGPYASDHEVYETMDAIHLALLIRFPETQVINREVIKDRIANYIVNLITQAHTESNNKH